MRRSLLALVALALLLTVVPAEAHHIREGDVRFKVTCEFSHSNHDDPIVHPHQPNAAHLHDYTGNRQTDAHTTTYDDLLAGTTTCNDRDDLAAYWVPALYADGVKVDPTRMTGYYRRGDKHGDIQPYPDGLKIITDGGTWQCGGSITGPEGCRDDLKLRYDFPDCWDGKNLDSADHRSHMTNSRPRGDANQCPRRHPVPVPRLSLYVNYPADPDAVYSFTGGVAPHADFFNGWVRARLVERIDTCLNELQRCDSGG